MKFTATHAVLILLLFGFINIITGIFLLAGLGWAIVAIGIAAFAFAFILSRGLTHV